jgi:type VI secretion system protein VasD
MHKSPLNFTWLRFAYCHLCRNIDPFDVNIGMRLKLTILILFCCVLQSACSTASGLMSDVGKVASFALETVGLKKPEVPELPTIPELPDIQKPPRNIALKLHAGTNLNAANTDKPLSLIVRVYKLKQTGAFYSTPYDAFLSPEKEKAALGADLVEVREVNLIPGQLYEVTEKVSRESGFIGIVSLFRMPAPQRWRVAFAAQDAEAAGITVGLHGCSLTVGKGATTDQTSIAANPGTPVRCQ